MLENKCGGYCFEYEITENCTCQFNICYVCNNKMRPEYPFSRSDKNNNEWCLSCDVILFSTKLSVVKLKERWENEKYCQFNNSTIQEKKKKKKKKEPQKKNKNRR